MAVKDIPTLPGYREVVHNVALLCLVKTLFCVILIVKDTEKICGLHLCSVLPLSHPQIQLLHLKNENY